MIVKIFSDFCDSETCKKNFEVICGFKNIPTYGIDKNVYITTKNDYTHAIIINKAMPILTIPKSNVIGFAFEPREFMNITQPFVEYAIKHVGKYFIGNADYLPAPFIEGFGYMWHSNPHKQIDIKYKTNCMSIVLSNKTQSFGHRYRHQIVSEIIRLNLPIDIYGNGSIAYNYSHVKGGFNDAEPYENYMYSICIENFENSHYISEKSMTPMMFNCVPIYWGCKNINSYFNEVIAMTGNIDCDIQTIVEILKNPTQYYRETYTSKNKKTVNLLENLETLF